MKKIALILSLLTTQAFADEVLTPEERIVALTLLGEARGEKEIGMFAVGCVIQKRALERNLTPKQVCLEHRQFKVWTGKKERDLMHLWKADPKMVAYARKLARYICSKTHRLADATNGANHFCHINSYPYWIKGKKPVKIIGKHKFYKL